MLSVAFIVRSTDQAFLDAMRWHLEPFRATHPGQHAFTVDLYRQPEDEEKFNPAPFSYFSRNVLRFKAYHLTEMLPLAIWETHAIVPQLARDFVFLHAGAVQRNGDALLLPASRDVGKSSLTAALLANGWKYLSDELGAIDPITTRAYPFPKLLSLDAAALRFFPGLEERLDDRRGLSAHLEQRFVRPKDLGSSVGDPSSVRWIVFPTPDYNGPPRLEPVASAAAVEFLASNSFNLHRYEERGVILLSRVAKDARAYRLVGGTPRERAELLSESLT